MTPLRYTFSNDLLFKMVFTSNVHLLKNLVARLLGIELESIEDFRIINPEIPPGVIGGKLSRLDINMLVDNQLVDIEIQVELESDYTERVLFYWAKQFSSAIKTGERYDELPRTIIISIMSFSLFDCEDYHSEYIPMEVSRHQPLNDKMSLHFYELPKLPVEITRDDEQKLWLLLFKAKTREELNIIEQMEVPIMSEAIDAYNKMTADELFREKARLLERAEFDEGSRMSHARKEERAKWMLVVGQKDEEIAKRDAEIEKRDALIANLLAKQQQNGNPSDTDLQDA